MNDKNFLKPLISEFPEYLGLARKIEIFSTRDHTPREIATLAREVWVFYKNTLAKRFKAERALAAPFKSYFGGNDPGIQALEENHSTLRKLAKEKDMDALYHFGHKLKAYVYFEMDDLFPRIEKRLNEKEKTKIAVKLAGLSLPQNRAA